MNKIVLISGASSGIGLVTANYLSEKGFNVIGISRSVPKADINFKHFKCDITNETEIEDLVKKV